MMVDFYAALSHVQYRLRALHTLLPQPAYVSLHIYKYLYGVTPIFALFNTLNIHKHHNTNICVSICHMQYKINIKRHIWRKNLIRKELQTKK